MVGGRTTEDLTVLRVDEGGRKSQTRDTRGEVVALRILSTLGGWKLKL